MTGPATTTVHLVDLRPKPAPRPTVAPVGRVPRIARLLALAHTIDQMVRVGELRDLADAARALGMTRARVSQVSALLLLAPEIQEAVLDLPLVTGRDPITERQLRPIAAESDWNKQLILWREIHELRAAPQDQDGREVYLQDGSGSDSGD